MSEQPNQYHSQDDHFREAMIITSMQKLPKHPLRTVADSDKYHFPGNRSGEASFLSPDTPQNLPWSEIRLFPCRFHQLKKQFLLYKINPLLPVPGFPKNQQNPLASEHPPSLSICSDCLLCQTETCSVPWTGILV